jgi:hypothetical protein
MFPLTLFIRIVEIDVLHVMVPLHTVFSLLFKLVSLMGITFHRVLAL